MAFLYKMVYIPSLYVMKWNWIGTSHRKQGSERQGTIPVKARQRHQVKKQAVAPNVIYLLLYKCKNPPEPQTPTSLWKRMPLEHSRCQTTNPPKPPPHGTTLFSPRRHEGTRARPRQPPEALRRGPPPPGDADMTRGQGCERPRATIPQPRSRRTNRCQDGSQKQNKPPAAKQGTTNWPRLVFRCMFLGFFSLPPPPHNPGRRRNTVQALSWKSVTSDARQPQGTTHFFPQTPKFERCLRGRGSQKASRRKTAG